MLDPEPEDLSEMLLRDLRALRDVAILLEACKAALLSVNLDLGLIDISRMPQSEAKRLLQLRDLLDSTIQRAGGAS